MKNNYTLLFPPDVDLEDFEKQKPDVTFADEVVECLNNLSKELLSDNESRMFSDVVTFAFFCRKGNLLKLKGQYEDDLHLRIGRGLLFHIAPSNVPINFGYSLVAGLLAGNLNIVRVSSKEFPQVNLIVRHLNSMLEAGKHTDVLRRIVLVRYDHSSDANAIFSAICNARVIWGGDNTIRNIRKNPVPPRSFDVCFADRYSISAINPDAIMSASENEMKNLAEAFYNDTFLFDQNACSSPHTIFWLKSNHMKEAKSRFWKAVHTYAESKYQLRPIMAIDKLTAFYRQSINMHVTIEHMPDNLIVRTELNELPTNIEKYRANCGYFSEYVIATLDDIAPVVNVKYQTLGYFGFTKSELTEFVNRNRLRGLDRIVPVGETTAFSLTWDGYNLIDTFTREVSIL